MHWMQLFQKINAATSSTPPQNPLLSLPLSCHKMASCSSSAHVPLLLLFFLFTVTLIPSSLAQQVQSDSSSNVTATGWTWTPRLRKTFLDGGAGMLPRRRRLVGRFQICAVCTCCGGPRGVCIPAPCCYAINCNIPNRPFGVCSFTPRTCNCFNCHI